jgi:hypothetical protein
LPLSFFFSLCFLLGEGLAGLTSFFPAWLSVVQAILNLTDTTQDEEIPACLADEALLFFFFFYL